MQLRSIAPPPAAPAPVLDLGFDLGYPAAWYAPQNPHAAEVSARLTAWFGELGVVADPLAAARLRALDVAGYGGLPFARASRDVLETTTAMLTLWIFYDDAIEGAGDDDGRAVVDALAGSRSRLGRDTPVVRGYRALGERFAAAMSPAWRRRHAAHFGAWILSVDDEAELAARFRAGHRIGVEEHLLVREINVGMIPVIDWIEYDLGRELPAALHAHPAMAAVVRAACRAVAFTNELYGYSKDRAAGWINSVACAERERATSAVRGFARVIALHDDAVGALIAAGAELVAAAPDHGLAAAWLDRLHHLVAGFAQWHARAPRYAAEHAVASGRVVLRRAPWPA